jgi:hypothetical protein
MPAGAGCSHACRVFTPKIHFFLFRQFSFFYEKPDVEEFVTFDLKTTLDVFSSIRHALWLIKLEIEDQQYPSSNQRSVKCEADSGN